MRPSDSTTLARSTHPTLQARREEGGGYVRIIERVIRSDVIAPNEIRVHSPSMHVGKLEKSQSDKVKSRQRQIIFFQFPTAT